MLRNFTQEFLKGILENEEVSAEDKISQILAEHEADTRGLVQKRDELLGSEKKLKEQIKSFADKQTEYDSTISGLNEQLKKNSSEEYKKYYENQLTAKQKEFEDSIGKLTTERDFYKTSHLKRLEDDSINESIKSLQFLDGLKDSFIARVLVANKFEPRDIDGKTVFLNSENKTIQEAVKEFSLTPEGKAHLRNPSSGGGASSTFSGGTGGSKTITREEYNTLVKTDPAKVKEFFTKGGRISG